MRIFIVALVAVAAAYLPDAASFGTSCNFRCQYRPSLLDHMNPIGCYCHSGCGRKFPCCRDKSRYCGSGGGGEQACMIPKKVDRATVVGGEKLFYEVRDTITYECPYHYDIKGSATRTCIGNNIWSPGPPRCNYVRFVCRPPRISDGTYEEVKKHYTTGDRITISCNNGYELQGSRTMTCSLNRWTEFTPSCVEDRCRTITYCSEHASCKNYKYYSKCICNDGYTGDGWICKRIPCHNHNCKSNQICVDGGDGSGDYTCECKEGYMQDGGSCVADPCFNNNCHANAACAVVNEEPVCACNKGFLGNGSYCEVDPCANENCHTSATCTVVDGEAICACNKGFLGNGTHCEPLQCDPTTVHGEDVSGLCLQCAETCCNVAKLRECRICIHMKCNGGEVCGEKGLSRVTTVCSTNECYENDGGFTVDTPDYVHCLDERGIRILGTHCCWIGD